MRHQYKDPPDGGYGWVVAIAMHVSLGISGGLLTALGIFLLRFMEQFEDTSEATVSLITSLCIGLSLCTGPISSQLMLRYGCRRLLMIGGFTAMCGFLITSVANNAIQLALGIGIVTGLGLGLVITPSMSVASQYFTTNYAIANGITNAGIGVGSTIFPPLFEWLINRYGWRGAAAITGGICLQICWCGALIRPLKRSKESVVLLNNSHDSPKETTTKDSSTLCVTLQQFITNQLHFFVRYPLLLFIGFAGTCFFVSFLNFQLFLPKVVEDSGYSSYMAAIVLTIAGITTIVSRGSYWVILSITGLSPIQLLLFSSALIGLPMVFFPLIYSYQVIMIASVVYGIGNGVTSALTILSLKAVVDSPEHHIMAIGWQFLFQGCGQIIGGYLGGLLGQLTGNYKLTVFAGGILSGFGMISVAILQFRLCKMRT